MTDKIIDIPIDIFNEMDYAIENLRYKILELNSTKPSISVNINDYLPLSENKKNSFTWSKDFENFSVNVKYNHNSNFSKKQLLLSISNNEKWYPPLLSVILKIIPGFVYVKVNCIRKYTCPFESNKLDASILLLAF